MHEVVTELAELVEDDVRRIAVEFGAGIVDFLDVALRARRAHDVGWVGHPLVQPVEALLAHVFGQHGGAVTAQDAGDGHAAPAVIPGRRPHGAVTGRVELPGDQARHQASVGGQHLVRIDHRETVAERQHDARLDSGQRSRQLDVLRHVDEAGTCAVVEPMYAEQVERMRAVRVHVLQFGLDGGRDRGGILELPDGGQQHAGLLEAGDSILINRRVDHGAFQPQTCHFLAPLSEKSGDYRHDNEAEKNTSFRR